MRVISLDPSATEIMCAIGAADLLVGRSFECDFPRHHIAHLPRLSAHQTGQEPYSGTGARKVQAASDDGHGIHAPGLVNIADLRPDLIITHNCRSGSPMAFSAARLAGAAMNSSPRVLNLTPRSLADVFDDVLRIGEAVGRSAQAEEVMVRLRGRMHEAMDHVPPLIEGPEIAFLERADPMCVGGQWIPEIIVKAGGRHSLNPPGAPSRPVEPEALHFAHPQRIIVCPRGKGLVHAQHELNALLQSPWREQIDEIANVRIALVDGNAYFSRATPRLTDALCWLIGWLHGIDELIPADFAWCERSASDTQA